MGDDNVKVICVGSRKSELALIQTKFVIASLQKLCPNEKFEIHTMTTMGDRVLNISLPKIGEKALFTKDLEDALTSGRVDFVVHSLKDLPTALPAGLAIGAILERADPRDALVLREEFNDKTLQTLATGSIIGTSSLRRGAQLARKYPHLVVQDIRGNLNTRLAKLDATNSKFSGIILAQAGLERMGWRHRISQTLNSDDILYAVGQGALAIECRSNDQRILPMLQKLCCLKTQCKVLTERSFLKTLGGGCSAPVAVITDLSRRSGESEDNDHHDLHITGAVWSLDGTIEVQTFLNCSLNLNINQSPERTEIITKCKTPEPNDAGKIPPKSNSPTIVDDTKLPIPSGSEMSSLLKIHGDLLKKCPYAANHQEAGDSDKCPLNFAVGQDVMGQCPYLSTEQKILSSDVKTTENATHTAVAQDNMGKCPFLGAQSSSADEVDKSIAATQSRKRPSTDYNAGPAAKVCPYLKAAINSPSANQTNNQTNTAKKSKTESNESTDTEESGETVEDTTLYCGLYRHHCYNIDWFEQCELLGQKLAKELIDKGALKVMEKAQQEIRKDL